MSKKSKNSNRGKNELDSILAQLKQSYATDLEDAERDEVDTDVEDDAELSSILEKIFANNAADPKNKKKTSSKNKAPTVNDIEDKNNKRADTHIADAERLVVEDVTEQPSDSHLNTDNYKNDQAATSPASDHAAKDVEDVLQLMFSHKASEADDKDTSIYGSSDGSKDDQAINVIVDESLEMEIEDLNYVVEASEEIDKSILDEIGSAFKTNIDVENENALTANDTVLVDEDTDIIKEVADINYVSDVEIIDNIDDTDITDDLISLDDEYEDIANSEVIDEDDEISFAVEDEEFNQQNSNYNSDTETYEDVRKPPRFIISPSDYINDPLQNRLPTMDTSVESHSTQDGNKETVSKDITASEGSDAPRDLNNNDISLLLKFGYNEEVVSKIGEENVQKVLSETDAEYKPLFYNTPYGFCGEEFSGRHQVNEITAKYRSDKLMLLIKLIFIAITSLSILAADIYFEFFADRSAFPIFVMFEFLGVALTGLLIWKKVVSGAIGIARFESNIYSTLVLIFGSYVLYDMCVLILYAVKFKAIDLNDLMLFGAPVVLYALLVSISELLNCIRESNTFSLISSSDRFYTAENHIDVSSKISDVHNSNDDKVYKIRKTSLISGYFKKTSISTDRGISLIYLIGVIPIMSLIIGCSSAIISSNVFIGINSMMMTTTLCTPIACVCIPAISEYMLSCKLNKRKTGFVGNISSSDYAKTTALYFTDIDAIDIISCTEIHPGKSKGAKEALAIAHSVFRSLGGPLGYATSAFSGDDTDERKEIVINSISENGIDLYFNSSLNILIGDKQYMQSHNLKVKTDTSLHTATKGLDRSVIYMAFDGVPKLGFIITSRIKPNFAETVALLAHNDIKVFVDSYEPQINDVYFEQNKISGAHQITICKSSEHDYVSFRTVCNGNIICAEDSTTVAKSILESKNIAELYDRNQRSHILLSIIGLIISVGITALMCLSRFLSGFENFSIYVPIILNILMICGLIPGITGVFKLWKKDLLTPKSKEKQNERKV